MSHYTVLVVGDDVDSQLAPFDETLSTEFHVEVPAGQLYKRVKEIIKMLKKNDELRSKYEALMEKGNYEDILKSYYGGHRNSKGEWGYDHNPDAKWDWYTIGGRWSGYFKLKKGAKGTLGRPGVFDNKPKAGYVDQARFGDIDWEGMRTDALIEAEKNYDEFMAKYKDADKKTKTSLSFEYGVSTMSKSKKLETKKHYLKRCVDFSPFAILKDGEWHESGNMGWFGISTGNKRHSVWDKEVKKLFGEISNDTLISIVDCHI